MLPLMKEKVEQALQHAYAPYSNYAVAACLCTPDDELFVGVNVENSAYGLSICAEASAICQMVALGRQRIKSILVLANYDALCPPCGACRQRLHEFSMPDTCIYLCTAHEAITTVALRELLPMPFSLTS